MCEAEARYGCDIIGLQMVDNIAQGINSLLDGEVELMVDGAQEICDLFGSDQIRCALDTNAERVQTWPPSY